MKNNKNIKFEINREFVKGILVALGVFIILIFLFKVFLIPLALSIFGIFIALLTLYPLLSIEFKFLGGIFFLFVYWYIFSAICRIVFIIIEATKDYFKKK